MGQVVKFYFLKIIISVFEKKMMTAHVLSMALTFVYIAGLSTS